MANIFFRPIATKVETTILIVKTACVLHNFLRPKNMITITVNFSHQTNPANKACSLTWKLIQNGQQIWRLVHEKNLLIFSMFNK